MPSENPVHLIPWDPDSEDHVDAIIQQREECGWDTDKITKWKITQRSGLKCLYWISLSTDADESDHEHWELINLLPRDVAPLQDTGKSIRGVARTPTADSFHPVGHISLDLQNPGADKVGVKIESERLYWIKTFFIKKVLQSKGIGRAAMDIVESMATAEPLCAQTLGLDTVEKESARMLASLKNKAAPKASCRKLAS